MPATTTAAAWKILKTGGCGCLPPASATQSCAACCAVHAPRHCQLAGARPAQLPALHFVAVVVAAAAVVATAAAAATAPAWRALLRCVLLRLMAALLFFP